MWKLGTRKRTDRRALTTLRGRRAHGHDLTIEAERRLKECEGQAEQPTWRLPRRVMRTKDWAG